VGLTFSSRHSQEAEVELYALDADWSNNNPQLIRVNQTDALPFKPLLIDACVQQPGTDNLLQVIGDRMMWPAQYRNFGTYETIVANHTVDVGSGSPLAAIRWYELRRPPGGSWSIFQQGTFAPSDRLHRWVGSIAMDSAGNIALGYSVSSNTVAPGIRYVSRRRNDPPGRMGHEMTILGGRGVQPTTDRWGNISSMSADPAVPCSFWYTNEYLPANGDYAWRTHIANVRPPNCEGTR